MAAAAGSVTAKSQGEDKVAVEAELVARDKSMTRVTEHSYGIDFGDICDARANTRPASDEVLLMGVLCGPGKDHSMFEDEHARGGAQGDARRVRCVSFRTRAIESDTARGHDAVCTFIASDGCAKDQ